MEAGPGVGWCQPKSKEATYESLHWVWPVLRTTQPSASRRRLEHGVSLRAEGGEKDLRSSSST